MAVANGADPYKNLTWEEWSRMHWRQRARVRQHREPPEPPQSVQLLIGPQEVKQLHQRARKAHVTIEQDVADVLTRHLARTKRGHNQGRKAREASS
jgi:hypothetical protein